MKPGKEVRIALRAADVVGMAAIIRIQALVMDDLVLMLEYVMTLSALAPTHSNKLEFTPPAPQAYFIGTAATPAPPFRLPDAPLGLLCHDRVSHGEPLDAVVVSDLHLGSENCQAKPLTGLFQAILDAAEGREGLPTHRLIINGDVFDSIDFRRLRKTHWKVLSLIRHLSDKIEVTWIAGNHDGAADIVSHLLGVEVRDEFVLESAGRRHYITHGHRFDEFIDDHPLVTWLADCIYAFLQKLDRSHYVARLAKQKSKTFLHCLEKIENGAIQRARQNHCQVAICGHTHSAVAKPASTHRDIAYYNSGCWTEKHASTYLAITQGQVEVRNWSYAEVDAV